MLPCPPAPASSIRLPFLLAVKWVQLSSRRGKVSGNTSTRIGQTCARYRLAALIRTTQSLFRSWQSIGREEGIRVWIITGVVADSDDIADNKYPLGHKDWCLSSFRSQNCIPSRLSDYEWPGRVETQRFQEASLNRTQCINVFERRISPARQHALHMRTPPFLLVRICCKQAQRRAQSFSGCLWTCPAVSMMKTLLINA